MAIYERCCHCRLEPLSLSLRPELSLCEVIAEELGISLGRTANPVYKAERLSSLDL